MSVHNQPDEDFNLEAYRRASDRRALGGILLLSAVFGLASFSFILLMGT